MTVVSFVLALVLLLVMTWLAWRARRFDLLLLVTACWGLAIRSAATQAWSYAGNLWSSVFGS